MLRSQSKLNAVKTDSRKRTPGRNSRLKVQPGISANLTWRPRANNLLILEDLHIAQKCRPLNFTTLRHWLVLCRKSVFGSSASLDPEGNAAISCQLTALLFNRPCLKTDLSGHFTMTAADT